MSAATCPNGHDVPAGAKFCSECGAPVVAEPISESTGAEPVAATRAAAPAPEPKETPYPSDAATARRPGRRRLLIGGGAAVVLVIVIVVVAALSGGKGTSTANEAAAQPTTTAPEPKLAPTRYGQLLPAGMSKQRAVKPLCATYKGTISRWQQAVQARMAAMRGVSANDPYAAAAFVRKPGTGWLRAEAEVTFTNAIAAASRKRLSALAGAKRRYLTDTMASRFNDDALYLCHESHAWHQTEIALSNLDTRTSKLVTAAHNKPWYPKGYNPYGNGMIAFQWDNHISKCQDAYGVPGEVCWGMKVITQNGCPSSVYAQISILQGHTAIDYSNDTLGGLEPGQVGELAFQAFESTTSQLTGDLKEIDCY